MDLSTLNSFPLTNALIYQYFNFYPFMGLVEWHDLTHAWFDVICGFKAPHIALTFTLQSTPAVQTQLGRAPLSIFSGAGNVFKRVSPWQSSSRVESTGCSLSQVNMARNLEYTAFSFGYCFQSYNFPLTLSLLSFSNSPPTTTILIIVMLQNKTKQILLLGCFSCRRCHTLNSLYLIRQCK